MLNFPDPDGEAPCRESFPTESCKLEDGCMEAFPLEARGVACDELVLEVGGTGTSGVLRVTTILPLRLSPQ